MRVNQKMKMFDVVTLSKNKMRVAARSEFHLRKMWASKYEKAFGDIDTIEQVEQKPAVNIVR